MLNTPKQRAGNLAAQMERRAKEQKALREPEAIVPVLGEMRIAPDEDGILPSPNTLHALLRNAYGPDTNVAPNPNVTVQVVQVGMSLERDGCDFIHMGLRFLQRFECPKEARLFVLAICGLSGGDVSSFHVIPDVKVAEAIGYEKHAIKAMREALIAWQHRTDYAFIDVVEGDYDPSTGKYQPTQYRPRIVTLWAKYMRRSRALRAKNPGYAISEASKQAEDEIIDEIADEAPTAPLVKRREARRGRERQQQQEHKANQAQMLFMRMEQKTEGILDVLGAALMAGENPLPLWEKHQQDVAAWLSQQKRKYPQFNL